jgi:hypothetical protein
MTQTNIVDPTEIECIVKSRQVTTYSIKVIIIIKKKKNLQVKWTNQILCYKEYQII